MSSTASAVPSPQKTKGSPLLRWSRRLTAILLWATVLYRFFVGSWPFHDTLTRNPTTLGLTARDLIISAVICWYAVLSQLRIFWLVALPVYLLFFPPSFLLWKGGVIALKPLIENIKQAASQQQSPSSRAKRRIRWKRLWLVLFFLWLIGLRTAPVAWVSWLPPILLVPVWIYLLRFAYGSATAPAVFADKVLGFCSAALEGIEKQQTSSTAAATDSAVTLNRWIIGLVRKSLTRYSLDRVSAVVHREALLLFSAALILTIIMSSVF